MPFCWRANKTVLNARRVYFGHQERKEYFYCSSETPAEFGGAKPLHLLTQTTPLLESPTGAFIATQPPPFRNCFFTGGVAAEILSGSHSFAVPFLRHKRVRKGFFRGFRGDSMHFRGHSRRIAPLLPPFVVYYGHRAVLCLICHSLNSYRAENRPVTANRAVFCFLREHPVTPGRFSAFAGRFVPKTVQSGQNVVHWVQQKRPTWRTLEKERILCKNGSSAWFWR